MKRQGQKMLNVWLDEATYNALRDRSGMRKMSETVRSLIDDFVGDAVEPPDEIPGQEPLPVEPEPKPTVTRSVPTGGRHWHKRVKIGEKWVQGRDVGEWACADCGAVL